MRCARCKRKLKNPIELNGLFYGPVCYKRAMLYSDQTKVSDKKKSYSYGTFFAGKKQLDTDQAIVTVDGRPLDPRLDLMNHSPDGFEWGYSGSGPAQLSLAILAACMSDVEAVKYHQDFKRKFVAIIPKDNAWVISKPQVLNLINEIKESSKVVHTSVR